KKGKLPSTTVQETYDLEYGTDCLEIHADAVERGQRVLIVDDVLATGGTAAATTALVHKLGGDVQALAFLVALGFLHGGGRARAGFVSSWPPSRPRPPNRTRSSSLPGILWRKPGESCFPTRSKISTRLQAGGFHSPAGS